VPIFAAPFGSVSLAESAELNPALVSLFSLRATEAHRDPAMGADPLCFRSREDLFEWDNEAVARLKARNARGTVRSGHGGQPLYGGGIRCPRSAGARPLQHRASRRVYCRLESAARLLVRPVLRRSTCAPAGPSRQRAVRLYEARMGGMFLDASNWRLRPPFSPGHHLWRPVAGQMAVFPASMLHEVALNRADGDLILVAARVRFASPGMEVPPW